MVINSYTVVITILIVMNIGQYIKIRLQTSRYIATRKSALVDVLTKLPNRLAFERRWKRLVNLMLGVGGKRKKFSVSKLGFLIIDIDNFKLINDRLGHGGGDIILREVSSCIKGCLREVDLVYRWGGEEIVVVLINIDLQSTAQAAEKIRSTVESTKFYNHTEVTVSVGAVLVDNRGGADQAFEKADIALYKAKNNGRNQVCLCDD